VLWLRGFDLDISCVRITPHKLDDSIVLVPEKVIPLRESEEYLTHIQEKAEKRQEARTMPTLEELYTQAEQSGYGEGFKTILEAADKHGLYPRLRKRSVMYVSPTDRSRALFTVWARPKGPRKTIVGVWRDKWEEIYSMDQGTFESIMGSEDWHFREDLPLAKANEFVAKLNRLFDSIKRDQGGGEQRSTED
jgi:hypothetical protein